MGPLGLMEGDPLLVQAEQKLIGQADELIVLADSSKFAARSSLLLCPLTRIHTVITDDGISDRDASMLEAADIRLIVAQTRAADSSSPQPRASLRETGWPGPPHAPSLTKPASLRR